MFVYDVEISYYGIVLVVALYKIIKNNNAA
jgi:hypothetical protein